VGLQLSSPDHVMLLFAVLICDMSSPLSGRSAADFLAQRQSDDEVGSYVK
jgi:hypothetical protein